MCCSRVRSAAPISHTATRKRCWLRSGTSCFRSGTRRRSCAGMGRARSSARSGAPTRSFARRSPGVRKVAVGLLALLLVGAGGCPAWAWGDDGHEIVAWIADGLLQPDVRRRVGAMLAADTDPLTAHDIGAEATWADQYRQADIGGAR